MKIIHAAWIENAEPVSSFLMHIGSSDTHHYFVTDDGKIFARNIYIPISPAYGTEPAWWMLDDPYPQAPDVSYIFAPKRHPMAPPHLNLMKDDI